MRNFLLLLLFAVAFTACKKDSDPEPQQVAGNYEVTRLAFDTDGTADDFDLTLPITQGSNSISGSLVATNVSGKPNAVTMRLTLRVTGQQPDETDLGEIELRQTGNTFELYQDNVKLGTADGRNINIDVAEQGTRLIIVARKV
ncbi:hypothetical protein [Fibrisoma montanum]|nr:hypothetical protein [Fibrisoma montanum]